MAKQGRVKWFNATKGFGFVIVDGMEKEVFIHFSSIQGEGYKTLNEGDEVELDVENGPKGLFAANVRVTSPASAA